MIGRLLAFLCPAWALRRQRARLALHQLEAGRPRRRRLLPARRWLAHREPEPRDRWSEPDADGWRRMPK